MKEAVILPDQAPVMPLPGAVLFPHALLPLYIFEPRYREMLAHALAHERMFGVALLRPGKRAMEKRRRLFLCRDDRTDPRLCRSWGWHFQFDFTRFAACFADFVQLHPFPIAEFETLQSDNETTVETDALGAKVLELYARFKTIGRQLPTKIDRYVTDMTDLAMLADLMASTFIEDPVRRQQVLEELDLNTPIGVCHSISARLNWQRCGESTVILSASRWDPDVGLKVTSPGSLVSDSTLGVTSGW